MPNVVVCGGSECVNYKKKKKKKNSEDTFAVPSSRDYLHPKTEQVSWSVTQWLQPDFQQLNQEPGGAGDVTRQAGFSCQSFFTALKTELVKKNWRLHQNFQQKMTGIISRNVWLMSYLISLKGEAFPTFTAASQQGATEMFLYSVRHDITNEEVTFSPCPLSVGTF